MRYSLRSERSKDRGEKRRRRRRRKQNVSDEGKKRKNDYGEADM
jgi:hypothetical protein